MRYIIPPPSESVPSQKCLFQICPADSSVFSTFGAVATSPLAAVPADHPEAPLPVPAVPADDPEAPLPVALARDYPPDDQSPSCHLRIPQHRIRQVEIPQLHHVLRLSPAQMYLLR